MIYLSKIVLSTFECDHKSKNNIIIILKFKSSVKITLTIRSYEIIDINLYIYTCFKTLNFYFLQFSYNSY